MSKRPKKKTINETQLIDGKMAELGLADRAITEAWREGRTLSTDDQMQLRIFEVDTRMKYQAAYAAEKRLKDLDAANRRLELDAQKQADREKRAKERKSRQDAYQRKRSADKRSEDKLKEDAKEEAELDTMKAKAEARRKKKAAELKEKKAAEKAAEEKANKEAEEAEKNEQNAQQKAEEDKKKAEQDAKREAEETATKDADTKAKKRAEAKARKEAKARAKKEADQRAREKLKRAKDKLSTEEFGKAYHYCWDMCIAFEVFDSEHTVTPYQKRYSLGKIVELLHLAGLETALFHSAQGHEVFCKVRAREERIQREAKRIKTLMLVDAAKLQRMCEAGVTEGEAAGGAKQGPLMIAPFSIEPPDKGGGCLSWLARSAEVELPYTHIYAPYDTAPRLQKLYHRHDIGGGEDGRILFRDVDRINLVSSIITAKPCHDGAGQDMQKHTAMGVLAGFFPLHTPRTSRLEALTKKWMTTTALPHQQPLDEVKDYYGERIALYFKWIGHYSICLVPPAVVGFGCWCHVTSLNDADVDSWPYFGLFVCLWCTLFLETWKRKSAIQAMKWGTTSYERSVRPNGRDATRSQYKGNYSKSRVTGQVVLAYNPLEKFKASIVSCITVVVVVAAAVGVITTVYLFQYWSLDRGSSALTYRGKDHGPFIARMLNAVQVLLLGPLYDSIAISLATFENHRTDREYDWALTVKVLLFQFVNCFGSLFYIAFIKTFLSWEEHGVLSFTCERGACMEELRSTLRAIFVTRLFVVNLQAFGIPWMNRKVQRWRNKPHDFKAKLGCLFMCFVVISITITGASLCGMVIAEEAGALKGGIAGLCFGLLLSAVQVGVFVGGVVGGFAVSLLGALTGALAGGWGDGAYLGAMAGAILGCVVGSVLQARKQMERGGGDGERSKSNAVAMGAGAGCGLLGTLVGAIAVGWGGGLMGGLVGALAGVLGGMHLANLEQGSRLHELCGFGAGVMKGGKRRRKQSTFTTARKRVLGLEYSPAELQYCKPAFDSKVSEEWCTEGVKSSARKE
jgi:hypothetical protein